MAVNTIKRVNKSGSGLQLVSQTHTANGSWICPPGVFFAWVTGYGGGGGGGGGGAGSTPLARSVAGGGGGGGSQQSTQLVAVVPGTTYTITIGAGGTANGVDVEGSAGDDTFFGALATFPGGGGGGAPSFEVPNVAARACLGGRPVRGEFQDGQGGQYIPTTIGIELYDLAPGAGGHGINSITSQNGIDGAASIQGWAGGASFGCGNFTGGGAGGGGGGGPGGVGGDGGEGGDGGGTNGFAGSMGTVGAANTGAGGGGGGSGGNGSSAGGAGANGKAGGSGKLIVSWIE